MAVAARQPLLLAGVPLSPGAASSSTAGQEGEHGLGSPWTFWAGWLVPAVEVPLVSGSWTEPSAMRYLAGLARQRVSAALDAGVSFPVFPDQEGQTRPWVAGVCFGSRSLCTHSPAGKRSSNFTPLPVHFPQTVSQK